MTIHEKKKDIGIQKHLNDSSHSVNQSRRTRFQVKVHEAAQFDVRGPRGQIPEVVQHRQVRWRRVVEHALSVLVVGAVLISEKGMWSVR